MDFTSHLEHKAPDSLKQKRDQLCDGFLAEKDKIIIEGLKRCGADTPQSLDRDDLSIMVRSGVETYCYKGRPFVEIHPTRIEPVENDAFTLQAKALWRYL